MAISMKTSPRWLQTFFEEKLPEPERLAETLTFHTVEVEEVAPSYIDLKVLPDRAAYLLCHRGAALELSAALGMPTKVDPLRAPVEAFPGTDALAVSIEDPQACARYMGALVQGVTVGPSPEWLREALESVGQRSINNVVDITNYVMLNIGQPMHAFDARKLKMQGGAYAIGVRAAAQEGRFATLDHVERTIPQGTLLITDDAAGTPLAIAGVKGGSAAEIDERTADIILEAANFDGTRIRRTAQALKLFTDASSRFQNRPSPALPAYAMRDALALILSVAGGKLVGVADTYPMPQEIAPVTTSLAAINGRLGSSFEAQEVEGVFDRLGFTYTKHEDAYTVLPPFERRDIVIPEDLAEEVGRLLGYDRVPAVQLPDAGMPTEQAKYRGIERIKDFVAERGFIEVSTQSFAVDGDIKLANPLQQDRPWLRSTLLANMKEALSRAANVAPRVLGPAPMAKLFELGTIFTLDGECTALSLGVEPLSVKGKAAEDALKENVATLGQELFQSPGLAKFSLDGRTVEFLLSDELLVSLGERYEPTPVALGAYRPFSLYPFALRDIAVWTPSQASAADAEAVIRKEAGDLLVRLDCFDAFEKDGRTSYAFRLVFEAQDRTLTDADINPAMERVTSALNGQPGFEVR